MDDRIRLRRAKVTGERAIASVKETVLDSADSFSALADAIASAKGENLPALAATARKLLEAAGQALDALEAVTAAVEATPK